MQARYLTKSRFKLGRECPTKLFYTGKNEIYYDNKIENDFLKALAEGGFQVGELAKRYYDGGHDIETLDFDEALQQTENLLKESNALIYEAAFLFGDLFIRADIVEKKGNSLRLIEVKAKSFDPSNDSFTGKKGGIISKWKPYLEDIAFQKFVVQKAYPEFDVQANLMLTNKEATASVNGLNQYFFLYKDQNRSKCKYTGPNDLEALGNRLLLEQSVDTEIEYIYQNSDPDFFDHIKLFAEKYKKDEKIRPSIGGQCSKCEFRLDELKDNLTSGFHECWKSEAKLTDEQLTQPLILDLWNFLGKDEYIKQGVYLLKEVKRDYLEPKSKSKKNESPLPFLSKIQRQLLQISSAQSGSFEAYLDIDGLKNEMQKWRFPLHFIDFETTAVAIPFNKGRKPYEQIAFQYSHHVILENGVIEHTGEWISDAVGKFPNFDFVRNLKSELSVDQGTIFRYSNHENTILNVIYRQLKESDESDKNELCKWIQSITTSSSSYADQWVGERTMVDLLEMVKRYYYDPLMKGSNSIKKVLPAVLNTSTFLQQKYSQPIYGSRIKSKNFTNHIWITFDKNGKVINPYELLPPIHNEATNELLDELLIDEEAGIADGGAAMIAFARMQFTEMSGQEREKTKAALLRYCELDTLAMVMIYEAWNNWCNSTMS